MEDLTFGEQVKIILSRKGITIKELAEQIEDATGKKMSRQNLTQRLKRDNFQEQDMRMIAAILGCPFQLSIFPLENAAGEKVESMEELLLKYVKHPRVQPKKKKDELEDGVYQQVLVFDDTPDESAVEEQKEEEEPAASAASPQKAEAPADAALSGDVAAESLKETEEAGKKEPVEPAAGFEKETIEDLLGIDLLDPEDSEDLDEPDIPDMAADNTAAAAAQGTSSTAEERDMTIGELYSIHKELDELEETMRPARVTAAVNTVRTTPAPVSISVPKQEPEEEIPDPDDFEPVIRYEDAEENLELGEMNPYTGREYQTNSVRMHPTRIGYVQVYDRFQHGWTDMTEWAFLGYQERKKTLLGRDYEPPIYLD